MTAAIGLDACFLRGHCATGPRLAGRPWTAAEDKQLRELLALGFKAAAIASKLNRSIGAVYARVSVLNETLFAVRSLPSERIAFYCAHAASKTAVRQ
jgi:hypothetical protein